MAKFFTPEFFSQFQDSLANDPKWQESSKGIKTTMKLTAKEGASSSSYLLKVEEGKTTIAATDATEPAEFSLEGSYETWTKVAKGEVEIQAAVLKGMLKFKGSITKILVYKDRFIRIAEVMRSVPVEF
jgi:putative sterol carrier protein